MVSSPPSHDTDSDILRILSSFFVVMIHIPRSYSFSSVFYASVARFCIPVFFMISGNYMLTAKMDGCILRKKCCKLFCLMVMWASIYYVYELLSHRHTYAGISDLISYLLTSPPHLWYIYAAIGLYLFTPAFYVFCQNASPKEFRYALYLTFFFGSIVIIALRSAYFPILSTIIDKTKIDCTLGFVFCYLFACYLKRFGISPNVRSLLYIGGLIGIAVPIILYLCLPEKQAAGLIDLLFSFFAPNSLAEGVAVYVLVKQVYSKHPVINIQVQKFFRGFSSCTLGIFLVHPLIIMLLESRLTGIFATVPCVAIPIRTVYVFFLSAISVLVLKKVPMLKKLVS